MGGLVVVHGGLHGLQAGAAAHRLRRAVLIADPAGLVVHGGDGAVVDVGHPVRLAGAAAGGEAQLQGPGAVGAAPGVPGDVLVGLAGGEALGDHGGQARAAAAHREGAGALGGPLAFGEHGALVASDVLDRDLGDLGDLLGAAAGAEHRLDLPRAQRRRPGGLDHAQCRTVTADGGTQRLVDPHRVPLAIGIDEDRVLAVVMDPVEFELSHRPPLLGRPRALRANVARV